MKNAIQSLDGIIYNAKCEKVLPDDIQQSLETALGLLRSSLDNFTTLIPSTNESKSTLPKILNAVAMLSRSDMLNSNIPIEFEYDRDSTIIISYPFQSLVQVIHNLVINAKNAICDSKDRKIFVKGEINEDICLIKIYDTGKRIPDDARSKIYEYGYSTTGGTGIGLFHAKSVVADMNGTIDVMPSDISGFSKYFVITLNLRYNEQDYISH